MNDEKKSADEQQQADNVDSVDKTVDTGVDSETTENPTVQRRSLTRYFWYLVLIIVLATIAWVIIEKPYQQLDFDLSDKATQQTFDAETEISQLESQLNNSQQALEKRLEQLQRRQSEQQDSARQQLSEQLTNLQQQIDNQRRQLQQLSNQLPDQQYKQLKHWRLFEAKQTVSSAARLLWVASDYSAALSLLKLADQQVAAIESARAMEIRQLLAADIARVEAKINPDKQPLGLTLMGLQQRINDLPNRVAEKQPEDDTKTTQQVSSDTQDWQANLAANWQQFLDNFIRIQASEQDPEPLLSATQRTAIDARLNLLLSMAQHALLTENNQLWRQYIDQLIPLVTQLKGDTDAAEDVVSRLEELRHQSISTADKVRLDSLDALAQAVDQGVLQ